MPVSKLKNLAIAVLLAANLILLCVLVPNRMAQRQQDAELRESLSELYAGEQIALAADDIPQTKTLYAIQLTGSNAEQVRVATALLGDQPVAQDTQSGYLREYSSDKGTCTIGRDGSLRAEVNGLDTDTGNLLEKMGFSPASIEDEETGQVAVQAVLDAPVFSGGLKLRYEEGLLVGVEGMFYGGSETPVRIGREACMSAADALTRFFNSRYSLGWVGSEIRSLEQGYVQMATASLVNVQLTPVWKIVTDSGSFLVDGLTGEISSVS